MSKDKNKDKINAQAIFIVTIIKINAAIIGNFKNIDCQDLSTLLEWTFEKLEFLMEEEKSTLSQTIGTLIIFLMKHLPDQNWLKDLKKEKANPEATMSELLGWLLQKCKAYNISLDNLKFTEDRHLPNFNLNF